MAPELQAFYQPSHACNSFATNWRIAYGAPFGGSDARPRWSGCTGLVDARECQASAETGV